MLKRWLRSSEHFLLLQRNWAQFPTPTWWLEVPAIRSSISDAFSCRYQALRWYTYMSVYKTFIYIIHIKVFFLKKGMNNCHCSGWKGWVQEKQWDWSVVSWHASTQDVGQNAPLSITEPTPGWAYVLTREWWLSPSNWIATKDAQSGSWLWKPFFPKPSLIELDSSWQ